MQIIVVSVNYRTTPIQLREKVSFKQDELMAAMKMLQTEQGIVENVIISTCNRTEIYAVLKQSDVGIDSLKQFLAKWFSVPLTVIEEHLLIYNNHEAMDHLFRVSAGIDSMVIGETQILGQVRDSFLQGQSIGTTGTVLNQLFKQAITFSKRAHAETNIGESPVSISYAAVQLLQQVLGEMSEAEVLVLGAGEMGELTVKNLKGIGITKISIMNRTFSTAQEMAKRYGIEAVRMDDLLCKLTTTQIVISSTASPKPVIDYPAVQRAMKKREGDPLYFVDIAVPRDVDADIRKVPFVYLYDIDDIQQIVDSNLAEREVAAWEIAKNIDGQVALFNKWLATLAVVPTMTALHRKGKQVQQQTLASMLNKIPNLTAREKKVLDLHTQSIVNQLLRAPIQEIKALALTANYEGELTSFERMLGIEQDVMKSESKEELAKLGKQRVYEGIDN